MVHFDDIIAITEKDIICVDQTGIQHTRGFIDFAQCANNFAKEHNVNHSNCVADRNATGTNPSISFYTNDNVTVLFFVPNHFREILMRKPSHDKRFNDFRKKILALGWTTYDLS